MNKEIYLEHIFVTYIAIFLFSLLNTVVGQLLLHLFPVSKGYQLSGEIIG